MNEYELHLLQEWHDEVLNDALNRIISCQVHLNVKLTKEQRDKFEAIRFLFPDEPPPSASGKRREHFTKKAVWARVLQFLQTYPVFRALTIDGILEKLEYVQNIHS
jgi:hypothetical protein